MSQWNKWEPLSYYTYSDAEYIVMARRNRKSGLIKFKSIRVNGNNSLVNESKISLPRTLIDSKKQWYTICEANS